MLKEKSRVNAWLAAIAPGTEIQARAPFTVVSSCPQSIYSDPSFFYILNSGPDLDPDPGIHDRKNILKNFTKNDKIYF